MTEVKPTRHQGGEDDHVLKAHLGGALELAASKYPTLFRTIKEGVQNALDAMAQSITIEIDQRRHVIEIKDNGNGVEIGRMRMALGSVCRSIKAKGELGRFGLGLMAPLDKCTRWTFTTVAPGETKGYHEWVFNPEEIRRESDQLHLEPLLRDIKQVEHPADAREDWGWVTWRSRLRIEGYKKDRQFRLLNLVDLEVGILDDFNEKMRKLQTMVTIRITTETGEKLTRSFSARAFTGKLIDEGSVSGTDCKQTLFRLYLAPQTAKGRQGRVVVGIIGDDVRISFDRFAATTQALGQDPNEYLDKDTVKGLSSGVFEGEILGSDLDLLQERTGFSEDAALADFCLALNQRYAEKHAKHAEEARESKEDHRFQRLGLKSLNVIEQFMRQVPELEDLLNSFKRGNIGRGHTELSKRLQVGETTGPELALVSRRNPSSAPSGPSTGDPKRERKSHHPFTVAGPEGRVRTLVSKGSTGLTLAFSVMYGSNKVAVLRKDIGRLTINTAHPYFDEVKRDDRTLMQYVEYVGIQTSLLHTYPPDQVELIGEGMDAILKAYVFQLINADRLAGRRPRS